jgi:hypothetical protein
MSSTYPWLFIEICFDDSWSDVDDQPRPQPRPDQDLPQPLQTQPSGPSSSAPTAEIKGEEEPPRAVTLSALKTLQAQLEVERKKRRGLQVVLDRVVGGGVEEGSESGSGSESEAEVEVMGKGKGKGKEREGLDKNKGGNGKGKEKMDIDTHYFDSYASNGQSYFSSLAVLPDAS